MGPQAKMPPPPTLVDACARGHRHVSKVVEGATGCRPWKAASTRRMRRSCVTFPLRLPGRFHSRAICPGGHRRWTLIPPTMLPLCRVRRWDGQTYACLPFRHALTQIRPQQFHMPGERVRPRAAGTSGCLWMTRIAWSGTGCIASGTS